MVSDGLDLASQLAVMDRRGQDALPRITHAFRVDGLAPTQLGAHGDRAEPLGLAGQEARRAILIDHDQRPFILSVATAPTVM